MDNRCRHDRRTVVVCYCPPITWTAEKNKTRAFTVAGIVKALIFYRMSCNRIHDYQLLSYSDAQTLLIGMLVLAGGECGIAGLLRWLLS